MMLNNYINDNFSKAKGTNIYFYLLVIYYFYKFINNDQD